ncbi:ATP-dependent DNA helicase [Hydrogenophaga sp. 5NK40-0174]|uniref:ATP-dependent DNA helicase n=1 Tax=Hydrogenophaga sp. 5NK40-0174 TaxID=3127649 RepID=UPI0031065CC6
MTDQPAPTGTTQPSSLLPALADEEAALLDVPVRKLCDFAARTGDLDLRFTPSPTGVEGIAGHGQVTGSRGDGYQRELVLASRWQQLRVHGRADGFDTKAMRLEEIKTHRGDAADISHNKTALHWAQAKVYGWMLCEQLGLSHLDVAIIYFNVDTGVETPLVQTCDAEDLRSLFETLCWRYLHWAEQEQAHRTRRDLWLKDLPFPFPAFRPGQRDLAEAIYKAHGAGRILMAQAPTGIGKTAATLFAALRQMPRQSLDRVFYLTARTTGRQLALDALSRLTADAHADQAPRLRVVERIAREKACEHPDKQCHGDSCPLAKGFYDRLPAARSEAVAHPLCDQSGLREVALAHDICPYYLGQEMLHWSDVAVGDYNHFFDLGAYWLAATQGEEWRVSLLVDEAHNLTDRARSMYSAQLHPGALQAARHEAPPALEKALARTQKGWNAFAKAWRGTGGQPISEPPGELVHALGLQVQDFADWMGHHSAEAIPAALQDWHFATLHFLDLCERFDTHSLVEVERPPAFLGSGSGPGSARRRGIDRPIVGIRNVVPGPHLEAAWKAVHSATLFSATLTPMDYGAAMWSLPDPHARISVPSPFTSDQLKVFCTTDISTRWADRQQSLPSLVSTIAAQYAEQPGNYLAFFSSFDYLEQAHDALSRCHPSVPVWHQTRGMTEPERQAFLDRFTDHSQGVGMVVLGGAFAEGIDLPGKRLIGAFIATLGMPQVNAGNERVKHQLDQLFGPGQGYAYAYLYPGLQKVVQAAGRVIRDESDTGCVWLLDDRYGKSPAAALLPHWWQVERRRAPRPN